MTPETAAALAPLPRLGALEGLIIDLLVARFRLGDRLWTFETSPSTTRALNSLEKKGLVMLMHGVSERTARASLTEEALLRHGHELFVLTASEDALDRSEGAVERGRPSGSVPGRWSGRHVRRLRRLKADAAAKSAAHVLIIAMAARGWTPMYLDEASGQAHTGRRGVGISLATTMDGLSVVVVIPPGAGADAAPIRVTRVGRAGADPIELAPGELLDVLRLVDDALRLSPDERWEPMETPLRFALANQQASSPRI